MKKIIYLLFLLMFVSCNDTKVEAEVDPEVEPEEEPIYEDGAGYSEVLVQSYTIPASLIFSDRGDGVVYINTEKEVEYTGCIIETEYDEDSFTYYAVKYGDTSYDRDVVPFLCRAFAEPLDYINVTTRSDYDAEHAAGSLINDMVTVKFRHYYDYVSSGYEGSGITQIIDYLENVNGVGYCMIKSNYVPFTLTFQTMPTESGSYIFDVEVKIGDAVLSGELTMEL